MLALGPALHILDARLPDPIPDKSTALAGLDLIGGGRAALDGQPLALLAPLQRHLRDAMPLSGIDGPIAVRGVYGQALARWVMASCWRLASMSLLRRAYCLAARSVADFAPRWRAFSHGHSSTAFCRAVCCAWASATVGRLSSGRSRQQGPPQSSRGNTVNTRLM